jgi:predicted DNA-binding protein (MmcQ/YjbR family)
MSNTLDEIIEFCESLPHAKQDMPFGINVLTYKIGGKIFIFIGLDAQPISVSLKNNPEKIVQLKEQYSCVYDGPYLNKQHWMAIDTDQELPNTEILKLVKESYQLIYSKLPKKIRTELEGGG